jgi:hypothetical protein
MDNNQPFLTWINALMRAHSDTQAAKPRASTLIEALLVGILTTIFGGLAVVLIAHYAFGIG